MIVETFYILHKIKILKLSEGCLDLDNDETVQKFLEIIAIASSLKVIVYNSNTSSRKVSFEITYAIADSNGLIREENIG